MKHTVLLDGRPHVVTWDSIDGLIRFSTGTAEGEASLLQVEAGIYSVLVNGASYDVKVLTGPNGQLFIDVNGYHLTAEVQDPRRLAPSSRRAAAGGTLELRAPMPGRVLRLLAAEGDQVQAGQGLLVVEAMKMQNELKAPREGRIASLPARPGSTVAAGEVLVLLA